MLPLVPLLSKQNADLIAASAVTEWNQITPFNRIPWFMFIFLPPYWKLPASIHDGKRRPLIFPRFLFLISVKMPLHILLFILFTFLLLLTVMLSGIFAASAHGLREGKLEQIKERRIDKAEKYIWICHDSEKQLIVETRNGGGGKTRRRRVRALCRGKRHIRGERGAENENESEQMGKSQGLLRCCLFLIPFPFTQVHFNPPLDVDTRASGLFMATAKIGKYERGGISAVFVLHGRIWILELFIIHYR